MYFKTTLVALLASVSLSAAAPTGENDAAELRLIKTSESDPGTWVTEEQKIVDYVSKDIHFVDITDIKDKEVLAILSGQELVSRAQLEARAVTYPTTLTHQTEAKALIAKNSISGPQSWLKTLTE